MEEAWTFMRIWLGPGMGFGTVVRVRIGGESGELGDFVRRRARIVAIVSFVFRVLW